MGAVTSSIRANLSLSDILGTSPTISNTAMPGTAGTELAFILPSSTKRFRLCSRGFAQLQLAYTSGASGTTYITIPPGATYEEFLMDPSTSHTLYIQSDKASNVVELISWA